MVGAAERKALGVVLALDDEQWADVDGGSLLVLAVLELVRRRHPVALVLGLRPAREPEWLGGLSRRPSRRRVRR